MSMTVWDVPEDQPVPDHYPVSGRLHEPGGQPRGMGALELLASIDLRLGALSGQMADNSHRKSRDDAERSSPGDYQYASQAVCPTPTAPFSIPLGSPDQGQWWNVRRITCGGTDVTVTAAGAAWVSVQGANPAGVIGSGQNPGIPTLVDHFLTLPNLDSYGTHQLVLDETEFLWVTIIGGTAGQQYIASVKAETYLRSLTLVGATEE